MGEPNFTKAAIPMRGPAWETFLDEPLDLGGGVVVRATAVSMGNPHLVLFLEEDPERFHVSHIGAVLERDERFPEGTNVEFARVVPEGIAARVWERGSGETLACGSGACAIGVAAHEAGLVDRRSSIMFPGGLLEVERQTSGSVLLTGPAERVFETTIDMEALVGASLP
jgi:diaminopimelate epimerase